MYYHCLACLVLGIRLMGLWAVWGGRWSAVLTGWEELRLRAVCWQLVSGTCA